MRDNEKNFHNLKSDVGRNSQLIRGTLSLAKRRGHAVLDARRRNADAAAEVVAGLGHSRVLFCGKILDVHRETVQGFARTSAARRLWGYA
jgi:DUF917 family protein